MRARGEVFVTLARRWFGRTAVATVVVILVTLLAGVVPASMTAGTTGTYAYDKPAISRVDAPAGDAAEVGPWQLAGAPEGSVSPPATAHGTSTTFADSVVATNTDVGSS